MALFCTHPKLACHVLPAYEGSVDGRKVASSQPSRVLPGDSSVPRALVSATGRGTFALAWPQWPSCSRRRCPKPSAPSRDLTMYRGTFLCAPFSGGSSRRSVCRRHLHRASRGRILRRACRTTRAAPRQLQEKFLTILDGWDVLDTFEHFLAFAEVKLFGRFWTFDVVFGFGFGPMVQVL